MKEYSQKIAISQRWEEEFQQLVKKTAANYSTSMTQLTVEALSCYIELAKFNDFLEMDEVKRRSVIISGVKDIIKEETGKDTSIYDVNTEGLENIGLIKDQVAQLLVNNPNRQFSTNEISNVLSIPQSTARTYVRQISEESTDFILLPGRPNKIFFKLSDGY